MRVDPRTFGALAEQSRQRYEEELLSYLVRVNPERALAMKPSKLRQFARDSVQRAQDHGLTQEGPVAMYVQLDLAKGDALRESEASGGLARHGSETQCERMKRIRRALCHLHVK